MPLCKEFNKGAGCWDLILRYLAGPKRHFGAIMKAVGGKRVKRALDVGGGSGAVAEFFAGAGASVVVLDPAEKLMARIRSEKITRVVGSAQRIPFKAGVFDLVYCVDSFHHFTNGVRKERSDASLRVCVRELLRVLKMGGDLVIVEFDTNTLRGKLIEWFECRWKGWNSTFFSREDLRALFESEGVRVLVKDVSWGTYLVRIRKK